MDIELKEGSVTFYAMPYRLNKDYTNDLENIFNMYRKAGIVKNTQAQFASPAFVVRKSDGTPRVVMDFRGINKITKLIPFPISISTICWNLYVEQNIFVFWI